MPELFKRARGHAESVRLRKRVAHGTAPSVLRQWSMPDVELALWQRTWPERLVAALDHLSFDDLPQARFVTTAEMAEVHVEAALCDTETPVEGELFSALIADVEALVCRFAKATAADRVEVRLEATKDDACRLFHADRIRARLITTYLGPGTEYVTSTHAAEAMQNPDAYSGSVSAMPRFAVGLFSGSSSPFGGLVHRAPRLTGTGRFRLFLSLNEAL